MAKPVQLIKRLAPNAGQAEESGRAELSRRMAADARGNSGSGEQPSRASCQDCLIRAFQGPADIPAWLAIHAAVFGPLAGLPRAWREADFRREFVSKPQWSSQSMGFAEMNRDGEGPVGTVAWTPHPRDASWAEIRWLAVVPEWRRRGVASRLLAWAERKCLQQGRDCVRVETLTSWETAVAFYHAHGYR
jgi:GNAT superfamily N-acetyltransferase